jgi:hypothetical protein
MKKLLFTGLLAVSLSAQDADPKDPKAVVAMLLKLLQTTNETSQSLCESYELLFESRNPHPTEAEEQLAERIQRLCVAENLAVRRVISKYGDK